MISHDEYLDKLQQKTEDFLWLLKHRDWKDIKWWERMSISFEKIRIFFDDRYELEKMWAKENPKRGLF